MLKVESHKYLFTSPITNQQIAIKHTSIMKLTPLILMKSHATMFQETCSLVNTRSLRAQPFTRAGYGLTRVLGDISRVRVC